MLDEDDTGRLLDILCIDLGFCLPPDAYEVIRRNPPRDVDSFVNAVIVAEGLDPQMIERDLFRQVRERVAAAFHRAESSDGA